jgi:hypothetical protein
MPTNDRTGKNDSTKRPSKLANRTMFGLLACSAIIAAGCAERSKPPLPGAESAKGSEGGAVSPEAAIADRPAASPPGGGPPPMGAETGAVETGVDVPLKLEGIGSKQELDHALAKIQDPALRETFEKGFRFSFTSDRTLRRFNDAIPAMETVLAAMPNFAPAYRVLAYAHFNTGGGMGKATELYEKSVELDPEYGEAHYALSFMLTQSDMERARAHFDKAMAMGIPDERNLREQFFH